MTLLKAFERFLFYGDSSQGWIQTHLAFCYFANERCLKFEFDYLRYSLGSRLVQLVQLAQFNLYGLLFLR